MSSIEEKATNMPDKHTNNFKRFKIPLKCVLKNPDIDLPKITDAVIKCNKIVINTLMFMKHYLLDCFEKNDNISILSETNRILPRIDKSFILSCMTVVCNKHSSYIYIPQDRELINMIAFYNSGYKLLIKDSNLDDINHLGAVLDYLADKIILMYENNIKLDYINYINKYVNVIWKKKETLIKIKEETKDKYKQKELVNVFCRQLKKIKTDILDLTTEYNSDVKYHNWIKEIKKRITPNKENYQNDLLYYDLQYNSQDYLPCIIRMMKDFEKYKVVAYDVFSPRNVIVLKSIKLNTTSLLDLLLTEKQSFKASNYLSENDNEIWKCFFRTEKQCFKKPGYTFHHMIETDGVNCFVLMLKNTEDYNDDIRDVLAETNSSDLMLKNGLYCNVESNTEHDSDDISDDISDDKSNNISDVSNEEEIFRTFRHKRGGILRSIVNICTIILLCNAGSEILRDIFQYVQLYLNQK
jgi:hypothetical protein